jgi:hypothetical protein
VSPTRVLVIHRTEHLDLTDEETLALLYLLTKTIETDRYPLSPRIQTFRGILAE